MYFTSTNSLYEVKGGKGQLVIENVSKENDVLIDTVTFDGVDGVVDIAVPVNLRPGEKMTLTVDTDKNDYGTITVTYIESDNYINTKTKTEGFSVTDNYSGKLTNATETSVAGDSIFALVIRIILTIANLLRKLIFTQ